MTRKTQCLDRYDPGDIMARLREELARREQARVMRATPKAPSDDDAEDYHPWDDEDPFEDKNSWT